MAIPTLHTSDGWLFSYQFFDILTNQAWAVIDNPILMLDLEAESEMVLLLIWLIIW